MTIDQKDDDSWEHCVYMRRPEGAVKLRYTIYVYPEDGSSSAKVKSPAFTLPAAAWKKVYNFYLKSYSDEERNVAASWTSFNSLADRYVLDGFAEKTEVVWDSSQNCFVLDSAPETRLNYRIIWTKGAKTYALSKAYDSKPYLDVTDEPRVYSGFPALSEIGGDVVANFNVSGDARVTKALKAAVSVTPKREGKSGEKAGGTADLTGHRTYAPEIYWKDIGAYPADDTMRKVQLSWKAPLYFDGMKFTVTGLGKPITVTLETEKSWWDEALLVPKAATPDDPNGIVIGPLETSTWGIYMNVALKPGKKKVGIRAEMPDAGGTLKGETGRIAFAVPKMTAGAGARIDTENVTHQEIAGENWLVVPFYDMNVNSSQFRVTVSGWPGQNPKTNQVFCNDITFYGGALKLFPGTDTILESSPQVKGCYSDGRYTIRFRLPDSTDFQVLYSIMVETILKDESRIVDKTQSVMEYSAYSGL